MVAGRKWAGGHQTGRIVFRYPRSNLCSLLRFVSSPASFCETIHLLDFCSVLPYLFDRLRLAPRVPDPDSRLVLQHSTPPSAQSDSLRRIAAGIKTPTFQSSPTTIATNSHSLRILRPSPQIRLPAVRLPASAVARSAHKCALHRLGRCHSQDEWSWPARRGNVPQAACRGLRQPNHRATQNLQTTEPSSSFRKAARPLQISNSFGLKANLSAAARRFKLRGPSALPRRRGFAPKQAGHLDSTFIWR